MPNAAPRVCARCRQLAQHGKPCKCRPAYEHSTHKSNDTRAQKLRRHQLRVHPLCQAPHCHRLATDVDHIVPLAEGGPRYERSNLQSLCKPHHTAKTAADAQRGKTRKR